MRTSGSVICAFEFPHTPMRMKFITAFAGLACFLGTQAQVNMALVGNLDYQQLHGSDISDVWGYVDELGNEYALVGVNNGGVSVVSLVDPTSPQEVFFHPGPSSIWRDLKVYNDHAYVTTEGGGGLVIVDLTPLPQSTALTAVSWLGDNWSAAHNIYIDENGIAYIFGADRGNGGVIFLDLNNDPMVPVEVGEFDNWYVHDGMARGDTLYSAHVYEGFFSIVDVSDKQAPVVLGTQNTGNDFTHNCWVSDDGDHLFTTDEVSSGFLGSYDISDPTDVQVLQQVLSDPGSGTVPHNTHFINDYIVTSYYRYGTTVHDVSRPANVIEVGHYDHSPLSGNGFNGGWGTYPYLPSGLVISTDIELGLFVFDVSYQRACYLEGVVRDSVTLAPVNNATVTVQGPGLTEITGLTGAYATGYHTAGTYTVLVEALGYVPRTIGGVDLQNGQLTQLDVLLVPLVPFTLEGNVVDSLTGIGIPDAIVSFSNTEVEYQVTTDASGAFSVTGMFEGTYDMAVGVWGHHGECADGLMLDANTPPILVDLAEGYRDDMRLDLGWTVTGDAVSGMWERDLPVGTSSQGTQSNPGADVSGDCGGQAYVTGNDGGSAGNDDVDDGFTLLTSPLMDLSDLINPTVEYHRWFYNGGGSGTPNDQMRISMTNGADTAVIETILYNSPFNSTWVSRSIHILDHIALSSTMRFLVRVADDTPGHLVEGGLDRFAIVEQSSVGLSEADHGSGMRLWPVPAQDQVQLEWTGADGAEMELLDMQGRRVLLRRGIGRGVHVLDLSVRPGAYLVRVIGANGERHTGRLVVE